MFGPSYQVRGPPVGGEAERQVAPGAQGREEGGHLQGGRRRQPPPAAPRRDTGGGTAGKGQGRFFHFDTWARNSVEI